MPFTIVHAQERRALRRRLRVDCQVVRERDFALVGRQAIDLSPHGMLVTADRAVLTGEPLVVAFRLPGSAWWFDAEGAVSRVVHGRRPGDRGRCFAVEFEGLDVAVQYFLHVALQGVPPGVPTRERRVDYAATVRSAAS
jgi:hypothetical protein